MGELTTLAMARIEASSPLGCHNALLLNCMDLRLDDGLATFISCDKGTNR